jgi:PAS domain S-box-containing protein
VLDVVTTGEEALRLAEEHHPNLVLMDVVLRGEMDGIEAAQQIHERFNIPVVFLTAHADDPVLARAKASEPFGYLIKPFRDRELHSTIEMALFKHELHTRLKESERWLSVTLNSVGDALIAADQAGCVKFMNPVAQTLTGWTEAEAEGRSLGEVFSLAHEAGASSSDAARTSEMYGLDGKIEFADSTLCARNGATIAVEANAAPIRNGHGAVVGTVVVFRDITERKAADARLRFLSEAIEQSSEGIALVDTGGYVMFINKAFAEMHGYSTAEVMGKHISVFHTPEQMPQVNEARERSSAVGHFNGELWHARTDGSLFPGLMHNSGLRDANGAVIGCIATLRDITDIKKTEEALRASHKELAAYSSSLEAMVEERTRDLEASQEELRRYSESLEKTNEALKIIIEGIEEQKKELEKKITHNLNLTVRPILDQLKSQDTSETVGFLVKSLEFNLANIFSSFGFNIIQGGHLLTPREIRICEMIRSGLSSKQIAKIIGISPQTVLVHRKNVRKKLSLGNTRQNLASFLKANL